MDSVPQAATTGPALSAHFAARQPSAIRVASIRFEKRATPAQALNVAIGNVSLPMHPAMRARLAGLTGGESPFRDGVVRYTATAGLAETREAFLHVIASSGFSTEGLHAQITDGGSQAMELVIVGCCGPAGSRERPLMLVDAAYTNYRAFAARLGRRTVSIQRTLQDDGHFTLPGLDRIAAVMREHRPGALVVIPYDNPTGQLYDRAVLVALARLCVEHDVWLVSDEAYRELHYRGDRAVSVWSLTEDEVPGITGRRISIETTSKVWNACGLRIGALVTDSPRMHAAAVAENTASLCSNHIGQWIFGALAHVSFDDLHAWYEQQRTYYRGMMQSFTTETLERMPGLIVSRPDASLYSVVDVRAVAPADFDALQFVLWCAEHGALEIDGQPWTLLTAPMAEFYDIPTGQPNPGRTQMRIAYVETPERMARVPMLLTGLLGRYFERR
jgi:aspartate aminotransferase